MVWQGTAAKISRLLAASLAALLVLGAPAVASAAHTEPSRHTKPPLHAKPSIREFHYAISRRPSGQRTLTLEALVRRARKCSFSSPRLTKGRKRAVACSGKRSVATLRLRLALTGALSRGGFATRVTIEASGPGGRAKQSFEVKVASLAAKQPVKKAEGIPPTSEPHASGGALTIAGDVAMVGLVEKLAAAYHESGSSTQITVATLPNGADTAAVADGHEDIGLSASDPLVSDPPGLFFTKIAREGVCVVSNDSNPITSLSHHEIERIFTGEVSEWSQVPGSYVSGPIEIFDYEASATPQEAFESIFLGGGGHIAAGARSEESEELMREAVAYEEGAIGFVALGKRGGVNPVGDEGTPCTLQAARSPGYVDLRNLWFVTKGQASGEALAFVKWIEESAAARSVIEPDWIAAKASTG
jgi:phosphate transport system substrate-binding protein